MNGSESVARADSHPGSATVGIRTVVAHEETVKMVAAAVVRIRINRRWDVWAKPGQNIPHPAADRHTWKNGEHPNPKKSNRKKDRAACYTGFSYNVTIRQASALEPQYTFVKMSPAE